MEYQSNNDNLEINDNENNNDNDNENNNDNDIMEKTEKLIENNVISIFLSGDSHIYSLKWNDERFSPSNYGFHQLEYEVNNDLMIPVHDIQTFDEYLKEFNSLTAYTFLVQLYLDIGHQLMLMKKDGFTTSILKKDDIFVIKNRFVFLGDRVQSGVEEFWISDLINIIIKLLSPSFNVDDTNNTVESIKEHLKELNGTPLFHSIISTIDDENGFTYL